MSIFNPKFGMTMNDDKPEDYGWSLKDFKPSQTVEFSFEPMEVNFDAIKEVLEAPSDAPMFIKCSYEIPTQHKLHKKKRIAKKWAKQGKTKIIRKNLYAEVGNLQTETEGEITNYTIEVVNEQAERIKQIREIFER